MSLPNASWCQLNTSREAVREQREVLIIWLCVTGVILLVGLVCNTLAIVVCLTSSAIRFSTTGLFLIAISAADLLYILGDVLRALNTNVLASTMNKFKTMVH